MIWEWFRGFWGWSSNSATKVRCFIPQVVEVHGGKGEKDFFVFVGFGRKLDAELVGSGKKLIKAAIVNVADFADFEVQVVKNGILDIGAVAAATAGKANAFLAVAALHCVDDLLVFAWEYLYLGIGAGIITANPAPASDSDDSQDPSGLVPDYEFVFQARHVLKTAPKNRLKSTCRTVQRQPLPDRRV